MPKWRNFAKSGHSACSFPHTRKREKEIDDNFFAEYFVLEKIVRKAEGWLATRRLDERRLSDVPLDLCSSCEPVWLCVGKKVGQIFTKIAQIWTNSSPNLNKKVAQIWTNSSQNFYKKIVYLKGPTTVFTKVAYL